MRLVLSAGEASGDQIAADLARALKQHRPDIELAGVAGPAMIDAGVEPWFEMEELNVMGLSEVIKHLPRLFKLRRVLRQRILDWSPQAFIGIDAPDFNLGLARQLRQRGVISMHYVSPSVWAWRANRIPKIARSLDLLLTLYPFEPELYRLHGLKAEFVGHHLADRLLNEPDSAAARAELGLAEDDRVIALLPGSRGGELHRHAALLAETAVRLRETEPQARLLVLLARDSDRALLTEDHAAAFQQADVRWCSGQTRTGLRAADVALAASGTVTLEAFLLGCPLVVFYKIAPSTYRLARWLKLVKSDHVSLPNILSGQALVPECLQNAATAETLLREARSWLEDEHRVFAYRQQARQWAEQLARGAGDQAARAVLAHLET
ncbi:MAG: lipid-A-disaccharide synthase [Pseudomonadota bacterium]